jgi:hypothetical protein
MGAKNTVHPPYLRYEVPAEAAIINSRIKELRKVSLAKRPASESPAGNLQAKLVPGTKPDIKGKTGAKAPKGSVITAAGVSNISSVKTRSNSEVTVTPGGNVSLGFNCKKTFTAKNNFWADAAHWELMFKNLAGDFEWVSFMGEYNSDSEEITFELDFSTYANSAYSNMGNAVFKVLCQGYNFGMPGERATSPEVTLNFNVPNCIGIGSLHLNMDSLEGGNNGNEPEMTVYMDAPAPPGGQLVKISVDTNMAGIHGDGTFRIPQGQTSGTVNGFLGTNRVYITGKHFDITVILKSDSGDSPGAHARVYLTKKKRN